MPRLRYATPEDVVRRATAGVVSRAGAGDVTDALDTSGLFGTENDRELIASRIEAVESNWDRAATPMRAVSIGSEHAPKYFDAKGSPWPINVYLGHMNVHPLDANMGDFIETRTARDAYTDITGQEGSAWTADYDRGIITVYRLPGAGQLPAFRRVREKFMKISYHLAAGGDLFSAGETTIEESLSDSSSDTGTFTVADASRLPRSQETMLVDGSEYVTVTDVDHETDEITIGERGRRFTPAQSHSSGVTIHFCPLDVRDAVAGIGAAEVFNTEDYSEAAFDGDLDVEAKIERWEAEWNDAVNRYTNQGGYR